MTDTIEDKILNKMRKCGRGSVFFNPLISPKYISKLSVCLFVVNKRKDLRNYFLYFLPFLQVFILSWEIGRNGEKEFSFISYLSYESFIS